MATRLQTEADRSALTAAAHAEEVRRHERFAFGRNWASFLEGHTEERTQEAERSLQAMLGLVTLQGRRFLDIGSGSGLFSLAARRLGAQVVSFDYDTQSVECTRYLRERFFRDDGSWDVRQGSVLDAGFVAALGTFDIVYSWGVLHHTGQMWDALANAQQAVAPQGQLFVALYNRQPFLTPYWRAVKRLYVRSPKPVRWLMAFGFSAYFMAVGVAGDVVRGRNPLTRYTGAGRRGMGMYHDVVDWIGGWPFEVASPEEVLRACRPSGFELEELRTVGGRLGCNEYVFRRVGAHAPRADVSTP